MHILRSAFSIDCGEALTVAGRRGFGLLTAHDGERPIGSHLPFTIQHGAGGNSVRLHVTRANPLAELADGSRMFLLAVTGLDAYISNDWYDSADQVSTWMYEAVQLTGPARRVPLTANRAHGDALLQVCEQRLAPKPPWLLDAMEPGKRQAMLNAIIGIELDIVSVEGQRKFNQHKPDADHIRVVAALEQSGEPTNRTLAAKLRELRPHLDYGNGLSPAPATPAPPPPPPQARPPGRAS